jgi:hypothetical protein|tara:strand:+ start:1293 stop:1625 length:333 start_codon:yes stop_codon:yes gene_type:complete
MIQVEIIDNEAIRNAPSSKFLTKEEMVALDPNWIWNRKSFIFKYKIPLVVDKNIAEALIKKYDFVEYLNKKNDLKKVKYQKLKKMATQKGIPWNETFVPRDELIRLIDSV